MSVVTRTDLATTALALGPAATDIPGLVLSFTPLDGHVYRAVIDGVVNVSTAGNRFALDVYGQDGWNFGRLSESNAAVPTTGTAVVNVCGSRLLTGHLYPRIETELKVVGTITSGAGTFDVHGSDGGVNPRWVQFWVEDIT